MSDLKIKSRSRSSQVPMNLLDRAVTWFHPQAGLERMRKRAALAAASGYVGARSDRTSLQRWAASVGASADTDTLPDLEILRARSRDLERNDPMAHSAISTKTANVIGSGHVVRPEVDFSRLRISAGEAEAWEGQALDIWNNWAESRDCDVTRAQTFVELEDLVYRSRLLSGDVFVIRRYKERPGRLLGTCVQVVEADRLSNPNWVSDSDRMAGGIEFDQDGAPAAYHFADRHAVDRGNTGGLVWRRVPAFDATGRRMVLHIHGPRKRPDMTRYAPMLAPVIEALKQRSRYSEAELMAAVVSACFAIAMPSPDGDLSEGLVQENKGGATAGNQIVMTDPGQIFDLLPGEEVKSFAPGRPNPQFAPFIDAIAREVGAGTDLPHEMLVKQFQASYSASRAALEMAWQFFKTDRALHVSQFCEPVYEDVITEAIARGLLKAPGFFTDPLRKQAWLGSTWMGPSRPTIDPVKDANADEKYLAMGVTTRTRIAAERFGVDYRAVRRRIERESAVADNPQSSSVSEDVSPRPGAADQERGKGRNRRGVKLWPAS